MNASRVMSSAAQITETASPSAHISRTVANSGSVNRRQRERWSIIRFLILEKFGKPNY
jgi:hypothetical protein